MLLFALPVEAHTRWFAPATTLAPYTTNEPTSLYLSVLGLSAVVIVLIGIWNERKGMLQLDFLRPRGVHAYDRAAVTFSMLVGAFLVLAGTHEYLFSPNLSVYFGTSQLLILLQVAVGLMFLVGFYERIAALVLAVLWSSIVVTDGIVIALEDVWVLGTAIFVFVQGNDYFTHRYSKVWPEFAASLKKYSLSLLRIATGLTLFVLGFSEKIVHPEFGVHFLSQYHWNFMQLLGFNYSDYLFTLSAGSVESLFGLVFMLGILTRLNALVVAIFFTIPLFILGPIELAGHLPHFAAVVILLLFGNGGHFLLVRPKKSKLQQ